MAAGSHRPTSEKLPVYDPGIEPVPGTMAASASVPGQTASGVPHSQQLLADGHQQQHSSNEASPGPAHAPQPHSALRQPQPINGCTARQSYQHNPEPLPSWLPGFPLPGARPAGAPANARGPEKHAPGEPGGRAPSQQPPSSPRLPAQQPPAGGLGGCSAPSRQADALADMMSMLLPPAAPGRLSMRCFKQCSKDADTRSFV